MGAETFTHYEPTKDVNDAFDTACEEAAYDYGHAGYTGTIAEKGTFVVINVLPVPLKDAINEAYRLIDACDPRIDDKWGPAGALRCDEGWLFFGWASS